MTKSELIDQIAAKQDQLSSKDVELAVKGFGSFSLHYRLPRVGRNPRTGIPVSLPGKYVPHFKPGKELRERVNDSMLAEGAAGF